MEEFQSGDENFEDMEAKFLPSFPQRDLIFKALPAMAPHGLALGKADFFHWVNFTLDYPDEIWEAEDGGDARIYHYLSYFGPMSREPAFAVEVCSADGFTEVQDYSLVLSEAQLDLLRLGNLVYSMTEEWHRETAIRGLNEHALEKYDEGRLEEAWLLINNAIGLSRSAAAFLFNNRGLIHWRMGKSELAKQDFLEAIGLEPNNGDPYFNLGLIYFDEHDHIKALHHLRAAVEINPTDNQFMTELGRLYLDLEREKEALKLFGTVSKNNPEDPQADFHLGHYFLYKKNDPARAVKYYGNGLKKDPDDQFAMADLAVAHWVLGNRRKSVGIRRDLERRPRLMPYTVSRLVYLNTETGNYDRALKYYSQAINCSEPFEPEWLHYNAALAYAKIGRADKALDTLGLAIRAGGEAVIRRAMHEKALQPLKRTEAFKQLMKTPDKRGSDKH
jgi:tetratricopeptide (TPR) repeat protein